MKLCFVCMYSLELPHRGDSNEYTQHTIIVKKIERLSFLAWQHDYPSVARTILASKNNVAVLLFQFILNIPGTGTGLYIVVCHYL